MVILEGQFIFHNQELRDLIDYRIYIETDDDVRLARMVIKETEYINHKPAALKTFFTLYEEIIKPCYRINLKIMIATIIYLLMEWK